MIQTTFAAGFNPPWYHKEEPKQRFWAPASVNMELSAQRKATILEHLRGRVASATVNELGVLLGCPSMNLYHLLSVMVRDGELEVVRERPFRYRRPSK